MTPKVIKIIIDNQEILVDRRDLKGLDLSNLRISSHGYVMAGCEYLHRLIMRPTANLQVDHRNLNKLDCRRVNLRICTHSENMMNRGKTRANVSGFKGVYRIKGCKRKKYRAQISANKKTFSLGCFEKLETASSAYQKAAKEFHGQFARINDPLSVGVL